MRNTSLQGVLDFWITKILTREGQLQDGLHGPQHHSKLDDAIVNSLQSAHLVWN